MQFGNGAISWQVWMMADNVASVLFFCVNFGRVCVTGYAATVSNMSGMSSCLGILWLAKDNEFRMENWHRFLHQAKNSRLL